MSKEKNKFKTFLKFYILFLIVITIVATIYVNSTLRKYEDNQIDNFMESVIADLKNYANKNEVKEHINDITVTKGKFETDNAKVEEGLNQLFKSDIPIKFEINKNSKDELKPVYDVYADDYKILEVGLDGSEIETRLSLLTFSNWKVAYINVEAENGLFKFKVSVPSNYSVYVNDIKLSEDQIAESNLDNGLNELSKYAEIPYLINYEVDGFIEKPEYKITDKNGKEVDEKDIKLDNTTEKIENEEDAKKVIKNYPNVIKIAEDWSLFLSNDLEGRTNGFYNIGEYLIKDSYLYNYAYKWATNVDITFISRHTLKNPAFTNEKVSNFVIYSDKAFSCEVYLDKNMKISNGNDLTDSLNERMYFAYYSDKNDGSNNASWKLVNMQSVTNNKE